MSEKWSCSEMKKEQESFLENLSGYGLWDGISIYR
jgi:hypothetical protein